MLSGFKHIVSFKLALKIRFTIWRCTVHSFLVQHIQYVLNIFNAVGITVCVFVKKKKKKVLLLKCCCFFPLEE